MIFFKYRMNLALRYLSSNTCPLNILTTRTYLSSFSPLISLHRSFQISVKNNNNNNNNNDNNDNNKTHLEEDNNNINNNKNDDSSSIQKNEQVDLFDKILSNDLTKPKNVLNDPSLSGKDLFSILKESLSKSKSFSSQGESISTIKSPLSETSPDVSKTSILDLTSFVNSTTETSTAE